MEDISREAEDIIDEASGSGESREEPRPPTNSHHYGHKERHEEKKEEAQPKEKKPLKKTLLDFYDKQYKKLMIIPFLMLIIAFGLIFAQYFNTGDFFNKDVSLKGGIILSATTEESVDIDSMRSFLMERFEGSDVLVRAIKTRNYEGFMVQADLEASEENVQKLVDAAGEKLGVELSEDDYSVEVTGSTLGESFFKQTFIALLVAFIFMSIVVFLCFRVAVPSLAVILSAFSDIVVTLAIVNLIGIKLSTAGIAAFLMLIGYSVDTDILLTSRVLKRKEGAVIERVIGAAKTGLTMTLTTITAVVAAMFLTQSEVIRQIMIIILIGLLADSINTWIQNVGLLRLYLEKKEKRAFKTKNV